MVDYSQAGRRKEMRRNPTNYLARANAGGYAKAMRLAKNKKVQKKSAVNQTKIEDFRAPLKIDEKTQRDPDGYFADNKDVLKNYKEGKITKKDGDRPSKPIPKKTKKKNLLNIKSKDKTNKKTEDKTNTKDMTRKQRRDAYKARIRKRNKTMGDLRKKNLVPNIKKISDSIVKTYEAAKKKGGKIKDSLLKKYKAYKTQQKQKQDTKDNTGDTTSSKTSTINASQKERIAIQQEKARQAKARSLLRNRKEGPTTGSSDIEASARKPRNLKDRYRRVNQTFKQFPSKRVDIDDPKRRRLNK